MIVHKPTVLSLILSIIFLKLQVHTTDQQALCSPGEFACSDKSCIPLDWVCDGTPDCPGSWDELVNCSSCAAYEFECKNNECILAEWRCDREPDCIDHSDEDNCTYSVQEKQICKPNQFTCDNGDCIPMENVCDNKTDCDDESDETGKCGNIGCSFKNGGCSHHCHNSPRGPLCGCPIGFSLDSNNKSCHDINECEEGVDSCSQICANTIGGYVCDCVTGYNVTNDGHGCNVKDYELLFMIGQRLFVLPSNKYTPSSLLPVPSDGGGMDYDYSTMTIYWADNIFKVIYKANLHGLWSDTRILLLGIDRVDGMAVDWVGKNLYWADNGKDTIEVASLSGHYRAVLVNTGLDRPRGIALDPEHGYMYWTDWGEVAKIERSHMDGKNRQVLVTSKITWPNGLALDLPNNRLYWADGKRGTIESIDLNGANRRSVVIGKRSHPFSIAIFGDHVIWTDIVALKLEMADKRTGNDRRQLLRAAKQITNVKVFHKILQQKIPNRCQGCRRLCLLSPRKTSCACQDMKNSTGQLHCTNLNGEKSIFEKFLNSPREEPTTIPKDLPTSRGNGSVTSENITNPSEAQPTAHEILPKKNAAVVHRHKKKNNILFNKINKLKKHKRNMPKNGTNGEVKFNDSDSLCLKELCDHYGICDYESMRSRMGSMRSNCSCVDRMKGECDEVLPKKTIRTTRSVDIDSHWLLLLIVSLILLAGAVIVSVLWRIVIKRLRPSPKAVYNRKDQTIQISNLPIIEDFDHDEDEPIYYPDDSGCENPIYVGSDCGQRTPILECEEPGDEVDTCGFTPSGIRGHKFEYSPITDDRLDVRENEFHEFVNPVYASPDI